MHATYFGANGWLLEFGALRVLVDPWLTGALRFPPGAWFFDLLLLTQGLDDHTHPDTLKLLPRSLPVVDLGLPVAGAFVRGRTVLPQLVERFTPRRVLASTAGGDVRFSGLLTRFLWMKGSGVEAAALLPQVCSLIDPQVGERYSLA